MTCQSDVIVLRKMEISIYTFTRSGIMENWIKHELYHLNNEILWWHDVTHDNMSSHDIRDMTSRHDVISIKLDIWLFLYVAVSELERWFYFCFARYLGPEIHSYYQLFAWPARVTLKLKVSSWSTWLLLSLLVQCICPTAMIFCCCFVRFLGHGIHSNYCHMRDSYVWPWNSRSRHGLRDLGRIQAEITKVT